MPGAEFWLLPLRSAFGFAGAPKVDRVMARLPRCAAPRGLTRISHWRRRGPPPGEGKPSPFPSLKPRNPTAKCAIINTKCAFLCAFVHFCVGQNFVAPAGPNPASRSEHLADVLPPFRYRIRYRIRTCPWPITHARHTGLHACPRIVTFGVDGSPQLGIKRERGEAWSSQFRGCPRNCERRAGVHQQGHWETGKAGRQGDNPRARRPAVDVVTLPLAGVAIGAELSVCGDAFGDSSPLSRTEGSLWG